MTQFMRHVATTHYKNVVLTPFTFLIVPQAIGIEVGGSIRLSRLLPVPQLSVRVTFLLTCLTLYALLPSRVVAVNERLQSFGGNMGVYLRCR